MKFPINLKQLNIYNVFLSNDYLSLIKLEKDVCQLLAKQNKSPESNGIIDDLKSDKSLLQNIEPGDARITLDVNLGIVKMRFLPKALRQKDVENALKISLETEMGHKLDKHSIAYDILHKTDEGNVYIVAYSEKKDIELVEKYFKKYGIKIKGISHFVIDFINALIDLNIDVPISVVYINKDYYFLLKIGDKFIDYKKVDIVDFKEQRNEILDDLSSSALVLDLEDIKLVYSKLFTDNKDFYDTLKNLLHVKEEIFPPYDFDCFLFQANRGIY